MAQILSRSSHTLTLPRRGAPSHFLTHLRRRSSRSDSPSVVEVIEVDLGSGEVSGSGPGVRRLEDAIHSVLVRRSAPDWLPFVPGASYWVPPMRRPHGVADLVGRLAAAASSAEKGERVVRMEAVPPEDEMAVYTRTGGWPSAAYFFEDSDFDSEKTTISIAEAQTDDDDVN